MEKQNINIAQIANNVADSALKQSGLVAFSDVSYLFQYLDQTAQKIKELEQELEALKKEPKTKENK